MLDHRRIEHKGLVRLVRDGDARGINPDWLKRCMRIVAALNVAVSPAELNVPGFGWHELKGARKGTFAVKVSANWRLTFKWDDLGPYEVNLEDYHGR